MGRGGLVCWVTGVAWDVLGWVGLGLVVWLGWWVAGVVGVIGCRLVGLG